MSLVRILRNPRLLLCVAVVTLVCLVGIVWSPAAPWHFKKALPPPPENAVQLNGILFAPGPGKSIGYVWEKTDFASWLQKPYSFNVSGGGVLDKADGIFHEVIQQDPGLRTSVYAPLEVTPTTTGANVVGTMTLSHALDLLTQGTACRWEVVDVSVLSVFCTERPILRPETQLHGFSSHLSCLERYFADPDVGPDADFNIPAGDAAVTVPAWFSTVSQTTCQYNVPSFLWPSDLLSGHPTNPIRGRYTVGVALRMMLTGSGLRLVRQGRHWIFTYATEPDATDS